MKEILNLNRLHFLWLLNKSAVDQACRQLNFWCSTVSIQISIQRWEYAGRWLRRKQSSSSLIIIWGVRSWPSNHRCVPSGWSWSFGRVSSDSAVFELVTLSVDAFLAVLGFEILPIGLIEQPWNVNCSFTEHSVELLVIDVLSVNGVLDIILKLNIGLKWIRRITHQGRSW
jgi:hypothetical protein